MFKRILVPTDFSETSDAAFEYARRLAARFHATLRLLHVVDDVIVAGPLSPECEGYTRAGSPTGEELLQEVREQLALRIRQADRAGLSAAADATFGQATRTIVNYASNTGCDLIVMGTHGRTGLAHALMGSVAEHVVRTARCPVLTVRSAPNAAAAQIDDRRSATAAA
jgi:nucleotide-binding universal stress UspA family protein